MKHTKRNYYYALATYVGTVMGVGLFGLPYVGAQAGIPLLVVYLAIGLFIAVFINRMYASVAVHTEGLHRLPGYANIYLGAWGKRSAFLVKTLALYGAMLGYLIIGGQFLANLFGGSVILYTFLFFLIGAFLIWQGARSVGPVELILLMIFLAVVIILLAVGIDDVIPRHFTPIHWPYFFVPYGVVLFSMWGASIVPEIKEELSSDLPQITRVIIWGLGICALIYLLFSLLVVGISGMGTSEDALSGLSDTFGDGILKVGYVFGIITTFTSFLALGLTTQKLFWYDYKIPRMTSWALATFIPLGLFIAGFQDFISVISITGAVMLGLDGILVSLVFIALKKRKKSPRYQYYKIFGSILIVLLSIGVILQLYYTITGF